VGGNPKLYPPDCVSQTSRFGIVISRLWIAPALKNIHSQVRAVSQRDAAVVQFTAMVAAMKSFFYLPSEPLKETVIVAVG
jgi:hypothetical protein